MAPSVTSIAPQNNLNFSKSNNSSSKAQAANNVVTLDVGGQIFQTTKQTLTLSGQSSILHDIANRGQLGTTFIDRDPELFSLLLSLLRTGNLPRKAKFFDLQDLIEEAKFYNIESLLTNSLNSPFQFEPYDLEKSLSLPLHGRDYASAISTTPFGTLHVSHGSKITSFDWSLRKKSTILTDFSAIDSLLALSPTMSAAGATDYSGLQIIDLGKGLVRKCLNWENATRSGSMVQAIGSNSELLFASFESGRRNSSSVMVYDLHRFDPVVEIGHCEIFGAHLDSAIPATKLKWIDTYNMLLASGSHGGPSGVVGNIRLWDVRSGQTVWELNETVDCFSDLTVSDSLSAVLKVGVNSGEVFYVDLRKLGGDFPVNPWICLGNDSKIRNVKKEGVGCKIEAHGNQVYRSKGGDIELWSEVMMDPARKTEQGLPERVFRKNVMGRVEDMGGSRITNIAFGGNKMFVTRKDRQPIEVWQSSAGGF